MSKKKVKASDKFVCVDCSDVVTGDRVLNGEMVYYAKEDRSNPNNNEYRCADCQDDRWNSF